MSAQPQLPGVDRPQTINDIARAREREQASDREPDTPPTAQTLSRLTDTVNLLLTMLGCPPVHRAYLDAVIGLADGRAHWFDGADASIGYRARGKAADSIKRESLERWTRREREDFFKWQTGAGLALLECIPGGQESATGRNYKTRYRVPLLSIAERAYTLAQCDPAWQTNPARAIRRAARPLLPQLRTDRPALRERAGIGRARHDRPESEFKRALTALTKGFDRAERKGADWRELCAPIVAELRKRGALAEGDTVVRCSDPGPEGDNLVRCSLDTCSGQADLDGAELPELRAVEGIDEEDREKTDGGGRRARAPSFFTVPLRRL